MEVEKILVVDDEPSILKLLKEVLTQWGYHVVCVGTGAEALKAIRTERFDAAITDIRMPAMRGRSGRAKGPFIPVNCSAIPENLLESEFFGHVRGAFSDAVSDALGLFRSAHEGTIFLDEIAELSPGLQVKLLRVLQEMQVRPVGSTKAHPVDVRVIAATNRDLDRSIADGRIRQDLYYRLNVVRVRLPPLRTRREDIPALVNHFLRRYNRRFRRDVKGITPDALTTLSGYDFPGNVRELENVIERAFAMGAREQITLADLPVLGNASVPSTVAPSTGSVPRLADVEKDLILRALAFYKDDKEAAASALGISRRTIYRRLNEYGTLTGDCQYGPISARRRGVERADHPVV